MSFSDDDSLIDRIRKCDQNAMRALFDRYYPRAFAFVVRRLADADLAEEVVADTFFEVWRSAESFRGASRVSTWIFGIATFKTLEADRNRRRHKRAALIATEDELLQRAPDPADATELLEARSELRWLVRDLDALSPSQREVARLALDGESTDEIAARLGVSSGTVKSRLSRARRELRPRSRNARGEVHQ